MAGLDNIISQILSASETPRKKRWLPPENTRRKSWLWPTGTRPPNAWRFKSSPKRRPRRFWRGEKSAADLKCRQGLLACRQQLISQVLAESLDALKNMEEEDYFSFWSSWP